MCEVAYKYRVSEVQHCQCMNRYVFQFCQTNVQGLAEIFLLTVEQLCDDWNKSPMKPLLLQKHFMHKFKFLLKTVCVASSYTVYLIKYDYNLIF